MVDGVEQPRSAPYRFAAGAPALPYHSIALQTPAGYTPNDASVGDLDGDGEYEIVVHQTGGAKDNSQPGVTDAPILQAYKLDGTLLWRIDLGRNIREGAHYTQFLVYDLDGDGRAEVVCKTADGTVDGTGKVHRRRQAPTGSRPNPPASARLGDGAAPRGHERRLHPERPGVPHRLRRPHRRGAGQRDLSTSPPSDDRQPDARAAEGDLGRRNGNRIDRFLAGVAYLDGVHPSVVMAAATTRAPCSPPGTCRRAAS